MATASLLGCGGAGQPAASSTTDGTGATTAGSGGGGASTTTAAGGAGSGGGSRSSTSTSGSTGTGTGTGGGGAGGGAPGCTPAPGGAAITMYCDQVQVAVVAHLAGKARVAIAGRLSSTPGACIRIDGVDVVDAGSNVLEHIAVAGLALHSDDTVPWAEADAVAAVTKPCGADTPRAEAFNVVVKGASDGGTFEVICGAHGGGSSWPPGVQLTCHDGLDAPPRAYGDAMVTTNAKFGITTTQLDAFFPEVDGIASVDGAVHVIPEVWMGQPLAPLDTTGWTATVSPGQGSTQVSLLADKDVLGTDACPVQSPNPQPGDPPPPILLARLKGMGAKGAFSSEVYVNLCTRATM